MLHRLETDTDSGLLNVGAIGMPASSDYQVVSMHISATPPPPPSTSPVDPRGVVSALMHGQEIAKWPRESG